MRGSWRLWGSLSLLSFIVMWGFWQYPAPPRPHYAFASDRNGAGDIWLVDSDHQWHNLTLGHGSNWQPTWSSDGQALAFTSQRSGDSDIWYLTLDSPQSARNLTQHPAWDYQPTWSPTGQSIAFVSERDGDAEIFVQDVTSPTAIQLTFNEEKDYRPAWSPDGQYIAFAAIHNGLEQIIRIRPDGTDPQTLTPMKATNPAWSPDSQRLAFIGWDDQGRPGLYLWATGQITPLYHSPRPISSLHWSGQWLTFTRWEQGNHDLFALPLNGTTPLRVSYSPAWDDFLVLNPQSPFTPTLESPAPSLPPPPPSALALGVNLADLSQTYLVKELNFTWAKSYVNWATVETEQGQLRWVDPDHIVQAFQDQHLKTLMRVHGTPAWARPPDTTFTHPPINMADFATFMTALATRYRGQVAAYEIWNEPNLYYEWGYQTPNPISYTAMLKVAYQAVKAADPQALVVSGGLATTGEGSPTAMGDLQFLHGMYAAGAKGHFDILGSHPYSFGHAPDQIDPYGLSLSRVTQHQAIMQSYDDSSTPIWITEVGWVIQTHWDLDEHETIGVTEAEQATHLVRTYQKVAQEWPFVTGIFIFNLDFSTVSWYPAAEPMRWYALLNPDGTPRPAFTQLRLWRQGQAP